MASYTWVKTDTGKEKQGENENQGENEQQNTSEKAKREAKQREKNRQEDMKDKQREKYKHEDFKDKRQDKIRRVRDQSDKARDATKNKSASPATPVRRGPGDKTKIYFETYTIIELHRLSCQEAHRERESCCCMSRQSRNCRSINICGNGMRIMKLTND